MTSPKDRFTKNLRLCPLSQFVWQILLGILGGLDFWPTTPQAKWKANFVWKTYIESHKHPLADPHFVPEPADHKMLYQNVGTCHEATGTCTDKCLVLGQAILPPFNLKIQCSGQSLSGCYNRHPCAEWEMKLYLVPYFLRLLSHPTLVTTLTRSPGEN